MLGCFTYAAATEPFSLSYNVNGPVNQEHIQRQEIYICISELLREDIGNMMSSEWGGLSTIQG